MNDYCEIKGFCVSVQWVTWVKPRRGAYCYARVWRKSDPLVAMKCEHRHRTPGEAMKCGKRYVRSGQAGEHLATE